MPDHQKPQDPLAALIAVEDALGYAAMYFMEANGVEDCWPIQWEGTAEKPICVVALKSETYCKGVEGEALKDSLLAVLDSVGITPLQPSSGNAYPDAISLGSLPYETALKAADALKLATAKLCGLPDVATLEARMNGVAIAKKERD